MYILEGNIGAGKSTLLRMIEQYMSYLQVVQEPVSTWSNIESQQSLLGHFYNDIPRWSYTMETYTMFSRVQEHLRVQKDTNPFKVMERSLYSGNYCFAKNGYLQGAMSELEWNIYNQWFDYLVPTKCTPPLGFIYLSTDPQVCFERTKKRQRPGEENIPLAYLQEIHNQHEDFLIKKMGVLEELKHIPVLILDGSVEFESNTAALREYLDKIDEFLFFTGDPRGIARKHAGIHHTRCCE